MTPDILRLEHVAVEIKGNMALTDVSFDVAEGTCLGLVGETGSGKSLTCRVITGLIGRTGGRITGGRALFNGDDLVTLTEPRWRALRGRKIALVPQASLSSLDPVLRVGRQLEEAIRYLDRAAIPGARMIELLEQVHMPRPAETSRLYPHELSGGMRQRVMIALALAGRPELLVADEPTTALDVTVQRGILGLLAELRQTTGMSVILVTHDLAVVQSVADSVAVMYAGRVVETGMTASVLATPAHPYTKALLAARPIDAHSDFMLSPIPGVPPGLADRPAGCPFHPRCTLARGRPQCRAETPALRPADDAAHLTACHFAEEMVA